MVFCCRFPELDNLFYALIVFDREQFFEKYEDGRSLGVSVVTIGLCAIGLCVQQVIALALMLSAWFLFFGICSPDNTTERSCATFI